MSEKKNKIENVVMSTRKKNRKNQKGQDFPSDILGSYTGVPEDGGKPIQDADDL